MSNLCDLPICSYDVGLWSGLWACGCVVVVLRLDEKCCSLIGCVAVGCSVVSSMRLRVLGTCGDVLVLPPLSIGTLRCGVLPNLVVYRSGVDG